MNGDISSSDTSANSVEELYRAAFIYILGTWQHLANVSELLK